MKKETMKLLESIQQNLKESKDLENEIYERVKKEVDELTIIELIKQFCKSFKDSFYDMSYSEILDTLINNGKGNCIKLDELKKLLVSLTNNEEIYNMNIDDIEDEFQDYCEDEDFTLNRMIKLLYKNNCIDETAFRYLLAFSIANDEINDM